MPQAKITINSVPGSNPNLPINTLVALDNQNTGGELTFTWSILDQPPGAIDSLSSVSAQNPTFTPKKEGTYLIRLIVNQSLPTEQEDRVIVGIEQLKTLERIPAAGETTEADTSDGWATAMNSLLRRVDFLLSDPGIMIGVNASGATRTRGELVRAATTAIIKSGLPGQEILPGFTLAPATVLSNLDELLCIVEGSPSGAVSVPGVGSTEARLMKVRYIGRISAQVIANGPVVAGDILFVNDTGNLDKNPGTIRRRVGSAMAAGSTVDVWFDGVGGAEIDLTPIDRAYVVYGNPGTLPNALRVDGSNAGGVVGGLAFEIHAGDLATPAVVLRRFSAAGTSIQEWATEGGTALVRVTSTGQLSFESGAGGIFMQAGGGNINFVAVGGRVEWPSSVYLTSAAATQITAQLTATGSVLFVDNPTYVEVLLSHGGGPLLSVRSFTTKHEILGTGAVPLDFSTDSVSRWRISATGELQAQGADRAIQNVLDPVNAQDAATRNFIEARTPTNYAMNAAFDFWQRQFNGVRTIDGGSPIRRFHADRWYVMDQTGLLTGQQSQRVSVLTSGLSSRFAQKLQRKSGETLSPDLGLVQEIDRDFVLRMRGKKVTLSAQLKKGTTFTGAFTMMVIFGKGSPAETLFGGYTTQTNAISAAQTLTTSFAKYTAVSASIIPTDATTMAIFFKHNGTGTAGADDGFYVTEVQLLEGDNTVTPFELCGDSPQSEFAMCQAYYEKTYTMDVDPGTTGSTGAFRGSITRESAGAIAAGIPSIQYKVSKRLQDGTAVQSAIYTYRTDNATPGYGLWLSFSAGPVSNPVGLGTISGALLADGTPGNVAEETEHGFNLEYVSGAVVAGGLGDRIEFHWVSDAEI